MKNNLRLYRKNLGFTLQEVADIAGTSKSYVWEVEQERNSPTLHKAYALARAVGQRIDTVFPDPNEYQEVSRTIVYSQVVRNKPLAKDCSVA